MNTKIYLSLFIKLLRLRDFFAENLQSVKEKRKILMRRRVEDDLEVSLLRRAKDAKKTED
jgi:hypothetical protein